MSAHTPAPWEWSGRWLCGKGKMILWYTTNDDGIHVKPEDARLIASGPELLEALQRITDIHCPLTGSPTYEELVAFWEYEKTQGRGEAEAQLFALAAIRKATGEHP